MRLRLYDVQTRDVSGELDVSDEGQVTFISGTETVRALAEEYKDGFDTDGTEWDEEGNPCSVFRAARPSDDTFASHVSLLIECLGLCTDEDLPGR